MAITPGTNGYCEVSDVTSRLQQFTIDANSDPTTTELEGEITNIFHMVNGYLDTGGYTIPVAVGTYDAAGAILKQISRDLAYVWTVKAAYQAGGNFSSDDLGEDYDNAMKKLSQIASGKMSLVDAPKDSDAVVVVNEQNPDGEFNLDTNGDESDPVFDRTTKW